MLKKISKMEVLRQTIFAILIGFAVVSFWRGCWGLMDEHLFPYNHELSYWSSILIGILILFITNYVVKELM